MCAMCCTGRGRPSPAWINQTGRSDGRICLFGQTNVGTSTRVRCQLSRTGQLSSPESELAQSLRLQNFRTTAANSSYRVLYKLHDTSGTPSPRPVCQHEEISYGLCQTCIRPQGPPGLPQRGFVVHAIDRIIWIESTWPLKKTSVFTLLVEEFI